MILPRVLNYNRTSRIESRTQRLRRHEETSRALTIIPAARSSPASYHIAQAQLRALRMLSVTCWAGIFIARPGLRLIRRSSPTYCRRRCRYLVTSASQHILASDHDEISITIRRRAYQQEFPRVELITAHAQCELAHSGKGQLAYILKLVILSYGESMRRFF